MKKAKCPTCGKSVWKSERFGDLYDKETNKKHAKDVRSLGLGASYGGSFKQHKHR